MFIDGTQRVMPEDRGFPRFLPRIRKTVRVAFGEVVDYERTFGDLRRRWEGLVKRVEMEERKQGGQQMMVRALPGELVSDELKYGQEAQEIRIECARRMREEILKLRAKMGVFPEPDPTFGLAETWRPDDLIAAKKYKSRVDGSNINQD